MPEQSGDKSQEPTPHRRQQAREKGDVARSQDLGSALVLLGALLVLLSLWDPLVDFFGGFAVEQLGGDPWLTADVDFAAAKWNAVFLGLARVLLPILGLLMLIAGMSSVLQVGLLFVPEKLAPDLKRIDPLKGFSRIFSLSGVARLGFGLFKVVVVAAVAYFSLMSRRDEVLSLSSLAVPQLAVYLVDILFWTAIKIAIALLVLALLDYAFQRWKHERDLRMTTQEIREEMKNLQGDPQIVARRRAVQRQLVMNRLSSSVPKADVVITNPTELAVAVQYKPETMNAPIVVAKGAGVMAQRIRRLALQHGIPIVEKKLLAQALFKEVKINEPISHQQYAAVAEILAYVYQLKGKTMPGANPAAA